jgi:methyl-accepting chemotaxis protein
VSPEAVLLALLGGGFLAALAWWRQGARQHAVADQDTRVANAIADLLKRVRKGDPNARMQVHGRGFERHVADLIDKLVDEFAGRAQHTRAELDQLRGVVEHTGRRLQLAADQLGDVQRACTRAVDGLEATTTAATALERLRADGTDLATQCRTALQLTARSADATMACAHVIDGLQDTVGVLRHDATRAAEQVQRLDRHWGRLEGALAGLATTGAQTDVLAVNAALAAAHDGTAGAPLQQIAGQADTIARQTRQLVGGVGQLAAEVRRDLALVTAATAANGEGAPLATGTGPSERWQDIPNQLSAVLTGLEAAITAQTQVVASSSVRSADTAAAADQLRQGGEHAHRVAGELREVMRLLTPPAAGQTSARPRGKA